MGHSVAQIERIRTREDLVVFLQDLHREHRANPQSWENNTLERFLEALAAWTDDMEGFYKNRRERMPDRPEWRTFAHMLAAATTYE